MVGVPLNGDLKFILRECGHLAVGFNPECRKVPDSPAII